MIPSPSLLVLGIESSGTAGGVALLAPGRLLGTVAFSSTSLYSQRLMPSIQWLLERTGTQIQQISGFAVSRGPGSFTGLRIGMSVAKALAFANSAPIVGISTLEALALRAALTGFPVCPILDARQGHVYAALYRVNSPQQIETLHAPAACALTDVAAWVTEPTVIAGDGAHKLAESLRALIGERFLPPSPLRSEPSAEEIALLGLERLARGDADDPLLLEPDYLRQSYVQRSTQKAGQGS